MDITTVDMPYKEYIVSDHVDATMKAFNHTARRVRYEFPNGWGASVVMGDLFYSNNDSGLYEACPTKNDQLCYGAIDLNNDDVYGYLNDEELYILLTKILAKEK